MASIIDKVAQIRAAIFGKDVRENIASGIEAINSEVISTTTKQNNLKSQFDSLVINSGSSNAELVAGRTSNVTGLTSDTMGHRMDGVDSQLENKATHDEVFTMLNMGQDVKTAMTGGSVAVVGVGAVLEENIVNNQVTPQKTNFLTVGKNLFDKLVRSIGYALNEANGALVIDVSLIYDTSDYIPVIAGVTYFINKCRKYVLYNSTKVFVSGYNNTAYGSLTITPSVNGFIKFQVGATYIDTTQLEIGSVATSYERYALVSQKILIDNSNLKSNIIDNINIKTAIITDDKINPTSNIVIKKIGKNIFDLSKITSGNYVNYLTGSLVVNASYSTSEYILITPSTAYTLSNPTYALEQLAYYDVDKIYISGVSNAGSNSSVTLTTPATARYTRITVSNTRLSTLQLELGNFATSYEPYAFLVKSIEIEKHKFTLDYFVDSVVGQLNNIKTIITVKQDGTGDFISLRSTLESIIDASITKQYEIRIYEGIYDIMGYYTTEEIESASFIGLQVTNYISLKGIGIKENIILKGEIADTFTGATQGRVSTIVKKNNGGFENLTVTAKNLRYAVHDDYNYPNYKRNNKNCNFIKYAGGGYNQAYGEGCWSGTETINEDCYYYTETQGHPYSFHNNVGFAKPSSHKLINCRYENKNGVGAIRFGSMGSGQIDTVEMIGCKLQGQIILMEEQSNGVGIDFELTGYGNDVVPVEIIHSDVSQYTYDFVGETKKMYNNDASIILKGTVVQLNATNSSINAFITSTLPTLFYGVAFEDIAIGGSGIIRIGGYLKISDTNLTGLVLGDKIGVVNGVLAKVTTGDYIGVVTLTDYIKLK